MIWLGLGVATLSITIAVFFEQGSLWPLLDAKAFLIVFGGSCGAALMEFSHDAFHSAKSELRHLFRLAKEKKPIAEKLAQWSQVYHQKGPVAIEPFINREADPFVKRCLGVLNDNSDMESQKELLEMEIHKREEHSLLASQFLSSMGGYAPTMGIVGAVLGLIHVLGNMSNPEEVGAGIAVAFVATLYGVGFANLVFIPLSVYMHNQVKALSAQRHTTLTGLLMIYRGQTAMRIRQQFGEQP